MRRHSATEEKKSSILFAAVIGLVLATSITAFAVPAKQVFRYTGSPFSLSGLCCSDWGPTVSITEPTTVAAVIVDFNADYQATGEAQVGLSLNGGSCDLFFGPNRLPEFDLGSKGAGPFGDIHYQWVIQPSDGLRSGKNTFEVCGGGDNGLNQTIVLGFNTLSVKISK